MQTTTLSASVFATELGWFGLAGENETVFRLTIGHTSAAGAWKALEAALAGEFEEADWFPALRRRLIEYARGTPDTFADVAVDGDEAPAFTRKIRQLVRAIPYGGKRSYGDLASRAGHPGAGRAVGTVMAKNPVPIIIPCHRVVGSSGKLGGFSAPQGIDLKRRMLEIEGSLSP